MKIYEIGDIVERKDALGKWVIHRRYSINPGGPLTYYDVYVPETSYPTEMIHLSQIKPSTSKPIYSIREEVLDEAKRIVTKDRNTNYGSPESNLGTIAKFWSEYLHYEITPHDVATMMVLMKVSRIMTSPNQEDHWVDIAGYAAIGAEVRSGLDR